MVGGLCDSLIWPFGPARNRFAGGCSLVVPLLSPSLPPPASAAPAPAPARTASLDGSAAAVDAAAACAAMVAAAAARPVIELNSWRVLANHTVSIKIMLIVHVSIK